MTLRSIKLRSISVWRAKKFVHRLAPMRAVEFVRCFGLLTLASSAIVFPLRAGVQHLEITGSQRLRISYDTTFTWPTGSGHSAALYLPIPPDTGTQHIESFSSTIKGKTIIDAEGHRLLETTIHPGGERRVHWHVEMTGVFQTRQLAAGPASAAKPISAPAPGQFLGSTESINWKDAAFQDWLDRAHLRRTSGESNVALGRRIYDYFRANGKYTYPPVSAWTSAACCQRLRTDCGGFSLVFTGACRANGIPARLLVGQCFKAQKLSGGTTTLTGGRQAHVIAEFFDPHIGWISEDISGLFLHTPGYGDFDFFGRDPGYFFAWHTDTDFHFNTPRKPNAHIQWIQNPNLWFTEDADGANDSLSHSWNVERL